MNYKYNIRVLIFISLSIQVITSLSGLFLFNLSEPVPLNNILLSNFDFLLTISTLFPILWQQEKFFLSLTNTLDYGKIKNIVNKLFPLLVVICLYLIYKSSFSAFLIIQGNTREELLFSHGVTNDVFFLFGSSFFKLIFPYSLVFMPKSRIFYISLIGIASIMIVAASRTEILYSIFLYLTIIFISSKRINYKKLILIFFVAVTTSTIVTKYLQARVIDDSQFFGLFDLVEVFSKYRVYSYYLADRAISISQNIDKLFYPFFGYFYERYMIAFDLTSNAIDTEFITEHINLSTTDTLAYANVLYPWWSWFYGTFGFAGIIFKIVYQILILKLFIRIKASLTIIYYLCLLLFINSVKHPFLTLSDNLIMLTCLTIDFFSYLKSRNS